MAKQVAITLKVNGTDTAVKNINELETAIEQLRDELKGVEIGSTRFKELSGELQNAESKLKTLNKSFEGLEPQQKAEAFVKLGEGIAGSFAIATAALTAFGVESEDVEKAQLAVTQALTAAIGVRQLAEAGLQAQVIATTISQKAYNLAATAGNSITKLFYTTIASNPIGAVITAITALGVGIYALVKSMEEQISVQDVMNEKLEEATTKSVDQEVAITSLNRIVQDETKSQEERQRALKKLSETLPELTGLNIQEEESINKINTAVERNIKLIQQRARVEVLSSLIIEKTKQLIETQNSNLEDNVGFWEKSWLLFKNQYNPIATQSALVIEGLNNKTEKQNELQEDINKITETYSEELDNLLGLEEEQSDVLEKNNRLKKLQNEEDKQQIELAKQKQRAIQDELKVRRELVSITQAGAPTAEIVKELSDELKILESAIDGAFPDTFQQRIDEVFSIPTNKVDEFGKLYVDFIPELSDQLLSGSEGFSKVADATIDSLAENFVRGDITEEAFKAGVDLVNNYKNLKKQIDNEPTIFQDAFDSNEYFDLVRDLKVASGIISTDISKANGEIVISSAITQKTLTEATTDVNNYLTKVAEGYVQNGIEADKAIRETRENFETEEEFLNSLTDEQLKNVRQLGETQSDFENRLAEEAQTRINNVINLGDAIIGVERDIKNTLKETQDLLNDINNTTGLARFSIFKTESDKIIEAANLELQERQRGLGLFKSEVESLESFRLRAAKEVSELIPEFEQLTRDQQLQIIDDYYAKLKQKRDENSEDEKSSASEIVEGLSDGLRQVSQVAQTGVQVFQEYVTTQLSLLEEEESRVLDQIVGDSEEANQKRIEVQEEYEQERKQITKQGQLAQLQLTRVQAIANVAEAVTKALAEGPIVGQILAGISAAIGLAQVGVVTTQINQVQSLARGGLLSGPSHENGGIPLAGGGVVAEGNEAVINRRGSIDYRNLLNEVSLSSGGAPIVNSSFDDTRLIEAITKQNRDPIKAYVLERDITESQGVNKRLQQLSKI